MKQSELSKDERRSMLLIQGVLLLVVAVGALCFVIFRGGNADESAQSSRQQSYGAASGGTYSGTSCLSDSTTLRDAEGFAFDPNTADSTELRRLGLSAFQVRNLLRYRAKGGIYHRPEEFKKLYGLTVEQWNHLSPLIHIADRFKYLADTPDAYNPATDSYQRNRYRGDNNDNNSTYGYTSGESDSSRTRKQTVSHTSGRDTLRYPHKLQPGQTIDLNHADTLMLRHIPGIGEYYARKIVQYREKLGGFVDLRQLDELEDLPLGIESYLTLNRPSVRKLQINRYSLRQLNAHPYLSYYQARAISDRVRQIGPFHNINELSMLEEFAPQDIERLKPYIDFSE